MAITSGKGFQITQGKGFHLTFANNYTLSVQWGTGNYSDHHHAPFPEERTDEAWFKHEAKLGQQGSTTAEVAIISPSGNLIHHDLINGEFDTVRGFVSPDELVPIINAVAAL